MRSMRERAAEGLQPGDSFSVTRTFTEEEVHTFARLSGDYNPVHFDQAFAELKGFKSPVAHGLLTGSLLTEIGGQIGWLASGMNFRFKRPVYVGEAITCRWTIVAIDPRGRASARVEMTNPDGLVVLQADVTGIVPGDPERQRLQQMLAEGDPTNGLNHKRQGRS
jgi:acyl dehydratase